MERPGAHAWTASDEMRAQADVSISRADDLRKVGEVAGPLYDSLDAAQQRMFGGFVSSYFSEARENDWRR